MIQARAVQSQADAHRRDLMRAAGSPPARVRRQVAARSTTPVRRSARPPDSRLPVAERCAGRVRATDRRLADRVRDQARRSNDPHVVSLRAGRVRRAGRSSRPGSTWSRWTRVAPCRPPATCCSSPSTSGVAIASRPSGTRCVRDADPRRVGRPRGALRQSLGERGSVRTLEGVPLHGHVPTPEPVDPERHATRRPFHQRGAAGAGVRATTPSSSATPTPRSIRARCRPATRGCTNYEGILPGFRVLVEDPWEKGSPAWGRWLAAHGVDVPANPHDLYGPMEGFPGADEHGSTWAPHALPRRALTDDVRARGAPQLAAAATATPRSSSMPRSSGPTRRGATPSVTTTCTPPRRSDRSPGARRREQEAAIHPLGADGDGDARGGRTP